jgi:hypothetical protein
MIVISCCCIQLAARYNEICQIKMPNTSKIERASTALYAFGLNCWHQIHNSSFRMDNQSWQDSESQNMPLASYLLNPLPGDVLAGQRESLYETATNLAYAMTVSGLTHPRIIESQLEDAIRFLAPKETPPAQILSEELSRITKLLNTIQRHLEVPESRRVTAVAAAVDVHCAERSIISTPPGNPRPSDPSPSSSNLTAITHPRCLPAAR